MNIIVDLKHSTHIDDDFLIRNDASHINFINAGSVTSIGDYFLFRCRSLESLDLTPLKNVISIDDYFLYCCKSLRDITWPDTPTWNKQRKIYESRGRTQDFGKHKRKYMKITTTVDLEHETYIYNEFFNDHDISHLNFVNGGGVTHIYEGFLQRCIYLESIDLSPLKNLTYIGNCFLECCRSLESLDLTPLTNVTHVGNYFLRWCDSLKDITWPDTPIWNEQRRLYEDNC